MSVSAESGAIVRRRAWAKINLTLHVTTRRVDGYHELDSLIVFAGVGDELLISPAEGLSLEVNGPFAGALASEATADNLVMRAAAGLRARYGVTQGTQIRLTKNLPVAAGLGGGSADAAAALRGLSRLWGLEPPAAELTALAAELGADVPVCIAALPGFVSGIGEKIAPPPPLPPAWLVLVNPGVPLATAAVFAARQGGFSQAAVWHDAASSAPALAARLKERRNDLESPAIKLMPEIADVLGAIGATPECLLARMSGSGATCFGLYAHQAQASAAAAAIERDRPAWWVCAAPMLVDGPRDSD